jgi:hypothetical protein
MKRLRSWVRIPLRTCMFGVCMCLFCVCSLPCLGSGIPTSRSLVQGVLPIVKRLGDWKAARAHKGCNAIQKIKTNFEPKVINFKESDHTEMNKRFPPILTLIMSTWDALFLILGGEGVCLFLWIEGSVSVTENRSKEAMGTEMGGGPNRPFRIEVGDDRNEGKGI